MEESLHAVAWSQTARWTKCIAGTQNGFHVRTLKEQHSLSPNIFRTCSFILSCESVWHSAHGAVVILWADVTAFLPPVDLEGATAADLARSLMGGLMHTCRN